MKNSRQTTEIEKSIIEKTFENADLKTKKAWNKSESQATLFNSIALALNKARQENGLESF